MPTRTALFDIGNTAIKIGFTAAGDPARVEHVYSLPSDPAATADGLGVQLAGLAAHAGATDLHEAVACSVAPALDRILRKACERFLGCAVRFVGRDVAVPLVNSYERPAEVGADRLVTAYAASRFYDAPGCVVVDFGTATTFDCVLDEAYLGGLICPGVLSSARALATRTAKLPQVDLELDGGGPVIGRSTRQSLNHGLLYGFGSMVEGLANRLKATAPLAGREVAVIGAGGLAVTVAQVTGVFDEVRPDLLLEGLARLHIETTNTEAQR